MLFTCFIITLITCALLICLVWHMTKHHQRKLRKERLTFQYKNLKNQINPHFLFSSLNTIFEVLLIGADKTHIYIQKLIEIYRFIMQYDDVDLLSMEKELEYVRAYLQLEKEHEKELITFINATEKPEKYLIVPVSVQTLIENTLKTKTVSDGKSLIFSLKVEKDCLVISNKIQKKDTLENSHETGLSNLHERAKLTTGGEVIAYLEDGSFIVSLPLI